MTQGGGMPRFLDGPGTDRGVDAPSRRRRRWAGGYRAGPGRRARPGAAGGSEALGRRLGRPQTDRAGDNAVYRLDADGVPREVLRVKALVHALVWADNRLLVGTGPEGQLYEVRDRGEETAPIAKLDSGQILALLVRPDGALVIGTGDPGSVVQLAPGYAAAGTLVSEVHDTKLVSRFGSLSWRADLPPRTSIAFETRTGNVGEPDETWSPWSATQSRSGEWRDGRTAGSIHPVSRQADDGRPAAHARSAARFRSAIAHRTWRQRSAGSMYPT